MNTIDDMRLIKRMLDPSFYDHPVSGVELIETHISWIFLAGSFAYKLKKPIDFGFLDFSTLKKRRHFCREELRLNKRFAPHLYLEVVTIGGNPELPELGKKPTLEYAVKMKRFEQQQQLDRMLAAGQLTSTQMEEFATEIAGAHSRAAKADADRSFGSPRSIIEPILQNFAQIRNFLPDPVMLQQVDKLERWSRTTYAELEDMFRQRKAAGFIRECHGDVHLANMAWVDGKPLLFDCIEFSESLRWIDPINDIAFLTMDLDDRGESALGWHFLNHYLQRTGDYPGMTLLRFYQGYRAMVRAKVICLRLSQADLTATERTADLELVESYLTLACQYISPPRPHLIMTHGFSGSGKTSFVNQLAPFCHGICLHSDLERKRLHHLAPTQNSHSAVAEGIYSTAAGEETYNRLHELAGILLEAGITVVVDATYIKKSAREKMYRLAAGHQVPLSILDFPLDDATLRQRIQQRLGEKDRVSEASGAVLEFQLAHEDPLDTDEMRRVIRVSPSTEVAQTVEQIAGRRS